MTKSVFASLAAASLLIGFLRWVRPWYRYWGATPEERTRPMPLDGRVPGEALSTRAITIEAPPERVWPWLVQLGDSPRGGYYSYTWIERLQGLEVQNAHRILPEYQTLHVGDAVDRKGDMRVFAVEPDHHLVLGPREDIDYLKCTWAFGLYPIDGSSTRLVTRVRAKVDWLGVLRASPLYTWPMWLLIDPGVFVMERKMLLEIKRHAEGQGRGVRAGAS